VTPGPDVSPNDVVRDIVSAEPPLRSAQARLGMQELVRSSLAFALFILLGGTIWAAFAHVGHSDWAQTKDLLLLIVPAETGLLGSAVGFYFGSRR